MRGIRRPHWPGGRDCGPMMIGGGSDCVMVRDSGPSTSLPPMCQQAVCLRGSCHMEPVRSLAGTTTPWRGLSEAATSVATLYRLLPSSLGCHAGNARRRCRRQFPLRSFRWCSPMTFAQEALRGACLSWPPHRFRRNARSSRLEYLKTRFAGRCCCWRQAAEPVCFWLQQDAARSQRMSSAAE